MAKFIFKSKKGGIPVINEIVLTFLNITPKPILVALFIILLTVIAGFIIPTILSMVGYTCIQRQSGALELYQIPTNNLYTKNILDISKGYDALFGAQTYQLPEDPFPNGNKSRLRIPNECFITSNVNGTDVYGYISSCTQCEKNGNFFQSFFTPDNQRICIGDGYAEDTIVAFENRKICSLCAPPYPYYFNYTNCVNEDSCYFTIRSTALINTVSSDYYTEVDYKRIVDLGGVKRAQDSAEMFNIQCAGNQKPSLYFFSIEMFNKTMWILLILGTALVTFALAYYKVVL